MKTSNPVNLKSGIVLNGLSTEMHYALWYVAKIYNNFGHNVTITSGLDGQHGIGSLHSSGQALDFRTYDVEKDKMIQIYSQIHFGLDNKGYDVVLESDHLHVEFDPKSKDTLKFNV